MSHPVQSVQPQQFLSVDNIMMCMDVFRRYMQEKFSFDVESSVAGGAANLRKVMYEKMQDVVSRYPDASAVGLTLRDLNNLTLNAARDHFKASHRLQRGGAAAAETEPAIPGLSVRPTAASSSELAPESKFKSLEAERNAFAAAQRRAPSSSALDEPIKESALDASEFEAKIQALRSMRQDAGQDGQQPPQPPQQDSLEHRLEQQLAIELKKQSEDRRLDENVAIATAVAVLDGHHPGKELFTTLGQPPPDRPPVLAQQEVIDAGLPVAPRAQYVIPPATLPTRLQEQYLVVNGFDRDWTVHRERFRVVADFGGGFSDTDLQGRYRNIRSLSMKRCIVPQEICDGTAFGAVARSHYNHNYAFNVPYVLVTIDEIADVMDGTNDAVRRSFCQMIVDKHCRSANGRGYFVLVSMQDEKKTFFPTPLSSLSRMTIAIRKPNGDIFNLSRDDFALGGLGHDPLNPTYVQVMLDKFFDKNEFFRGDTIRIKGWKGSLASAASRRLEEFVNRTSGHDILEMGQPNAQGYYKTFYLRAPGAFDPEQGKFAADADAIQAIGEASSPAAGAAAVINMSLQCTFSFKMELVTPDASATVLSH